MHDELAAVDNHARERDPEGAVRDHLLHRGRTADLPVDDHADRKVQRNTHKDPFVLPPK